MTSTSLTAKPGPSEFVPIRNIWLLQIYASHLYQRGEITDTMLEDPDASLPMLATRMLCEAVQDRLRHDLSRGFTRTSGVLGRVRGRIDLLRSERDSLFAKGRVACEYNEVTVDTPANQYLRHALDAAATMLRQLSPALAGPGDSPTDLAHRCAMLSRMLVQSGVSPRVAPAAPPRSNNRLTARDSTALDTAHLVLRLQLPGGQRGTQKFRHPLHTENQLRTLFEAALLGLYRFHLSPLGWEVHGTRVLQWQVDETMRELPRMETDITLLNPSGQRIIADAKFTGITHRNYGQERLRSPHLYQLYAYLMSQHGRGPEWDEAAGVMIYASLGEDREVTMSIQGHPMKFSTVDLTGTARTIREQALAAVYFP
ncbi:restriction endonuclease [Corynebacterium sp. YIM 101645]|uniref:Restriction endonuclease n=1 Tax=Corynebacterium lemuris TaxID=1859292 RepID=A0ABT2FYZ1_9CORY|nr:restriction endonuclease [Corynebacterium lemuris]MCS5480234.1 restriction endonuclease [Corynebacterium lemuris]